MRVDGNLGKHVYLNGGLDLESRNTRYQLLAPIQNDFGTGDEVNVEPDLVVRNVDAFLYGLYADVALTFDKLKLIPGLRLDGYLLNGSSRASLDPRLVGRYQIDKKWLAKGYVGLFHQPPQPEALDPEFGNPDLELERALHTGLGAEWKFADKWFADAEVYFIDRRNLVEFTDEFEENPDTGQLEPVVYRNTRVGDTVGLELLVRREITRQLYGWLSYTLSRTRELESRRDDYGPSAFDQRHTLNAVASYRFGSGWEFGGRFRLATGRPETDVVGGTYDADEGDFEQSFGPFRAVRRKTFHQLDTRLEKTWTFDNWRLGDYLDIQNLLNIDNIEATQYDYRYRERAPVTSVPFLPTIGVRGSW
jgi:outer membrane receptor protein involved in Fe transport